VSGGRGRRHDRQQQSKIGGRDGAMTGSSNRKGEIA